MRTLGSIGSVNFLGQSFATLAVAVSLALVGSGSSSDVEAAQYQPVQSQVRTANSQQRYVSRTTRRIAVPVRNQRVYSAPQGATLLRSRYWDPRTRWMVDPRTHSSYSVLSNGEVWFMEPSSGWAYTVDRYGRVYGADPRRNSIYAFSSLNNWRGDLFYFFDFFSPYDGYYTVRDYDWFYSSYYGRRTALFDYGYAYNSMWNDFDDFWGSSRFSRSINFRYYDPRFIRYGSGWNSNYYQSGLPAVYIAPCYSYTVVNNIVVVNNNYYTNNNIVNTSGRGLPSAEQAAVQLSQQVAAPAMFAGNEISSQQIADAGITAPIEMVKEVSVQEMVPVVANEPVFEVPGLVQPTPGEPIAPVNAEPIAQQPGDNSAEKNPAMADPVVDSSAEKNPGFSEPISEQGLMKPAQPVDSIQPVDPVVSDSQGQKEVEPVYAEPVAQEQEIQPVYQEPAYENQKEEQPSYKEPATLEPSYQEPTYQEQAREEPVYENQMEERPSYDAPVEQNYEQPSYEAPQEQSYEQPSYEAPQEQSYEQPSYEAPQEQSYEQPSYDEQKEQSYEQPSYESQQEQSYEQPSYEASQEQSYEQPSYEAPQEQSYEQPSYEAPQEQSYEQPSYEAPEQEKEQEQEQPRNEQAKPQGM